jgi:hypothetical protein
MCVNYGILKKIVNFQVTICGEQDWRASRCDSAS